MRHLRSLSFLVAAGTALLASSLLAQVSSVAPRIAGPVDETSLTVLKGNVSPLARAEFDKGQASPSTELYGVRLVFSRSAQQQAALDKLMSEQLDKNSPNYQHWLTPQEFDSQFGIADSDLAGIYAWLESHGLKIDALSNHTGVAFSGTVSQIEEALHTPIHSFEGYGQRYFSNTKEPQIPAVLTAVVSGIAHLNTYHPVSHIAKASPGMLDPQSGRFTADESQSRLANPDLTTTSNGNFLWVVPADAATIYNSPNAYNAAFSGTSYTGSGVTIGIGGVSAIKPATVQSFRSRFLNGDTTAPIITNINNSAVADDATDEAYLDVELSGGMAPGATIHFYTQSQTTDQGLYGVVPQMILDNTVDIFSLSFGLCEYKFTTSENQQWSDWWQQAATQGIAVLVSTGDNGAAGCDNQNSQQTATLGLQVNALASTPYNIAVGGTDYQGLLSSFSTYVGTQNSAGVFYRTANRYIPESTWNDSVITDGLLASNHPYINAQSGRGNIIGGSGGVSSCSTNTSSRPSGFIQGTCTNGYAKPSWQRGAGVPNDNARDLPDVSLLAGNGFDHAAWLVCTDDLRSDNNLPQDCTSQSGTFYFVGFGGTSTSAPAFAGILALVQEKLGGGKAHRLGLAAKTLYDLYNGPHATDVFHDITSGNISVPCTASSKNCAKNTANFNFLTGYDTTAGYDLATGLGSVDVTSLVTFWPTGVGTNSSTVAATPSATTITTAQPVTINVTITGAQGTPTGNVSLTGGGYTSSSQALDTNGKAAIVIPAGSLSLGADTLTITYTGDATYSSSTGTTQVTVTALATPSIVVSPASGTVDKEQPLNVTVTVSGSSGTPTGTITLSGGGYTSAATTLASGNVVITIPANTFPTTGPVTLTASYSGDTSYAAGTNTANITVTTTKVAPTVTVTPAAGPYFVNQALSVVVSVTGTAGTVTGTVIISGGTFTSPAGTLASGSATLVIPANKLPAGTDTLTASYSGDTNYDSASGTASVTVTKVTPTVAVNPASTTISANQALNVTVSVSGSNPNATGTVTLSGGGYTSAATTLASGNALIAIPANSLAVGSETLTATYSGDATYTTATGVSAAVTVNAPLVLTVPTPPAAIAKGASADVTIGLKTDGVYTGTVAVTCSLATQPSGASNLPACSISAGSSLTFSPAATTGNATVHITTTAATSASLERHGLPAWAGATGGSALALLVFFGIPARRRSWRNLLGLMVVLAALGSFCGCGGGGNNGGGGGGGNPGTTAGTYTFTVTGTGTPAINPAPTTTVTLVVN